MAANGAEILDADELCVISESDYAEEDEPIPVDDAAITSSSPLLLVPAMPDFESLAPEEIRSQLSSYGLKPIKSREAAIAMLQECWASDRATKFPHSIRQSTAAQVTAAGQTRVPQQQSENGASAAPKSRQKGKAEADAATSELAVHLCDAIQSQQRSPGAQAAGNPTWHEKILLYDPISVEALTRWLNTGGLDRVGEDREVSPAFVKEWCEQRGICCSLK
ncbi:5'-flap endonuclease [Ascosphaera acerosa]|nr:5'-flap endonuclease [Ascosphaera acerosa]